MALTEAKAKANQRYRDKYEYITTRVFPFEKKILTEHAEKMGESLNTFMRRAAEEAIIRDNERLINKAGK